MTEQLNLFGEENKDTKLGHSTIKYKNTASISNTS